MPPKRKLDVDNKPGPPIDEGTKKQKIEETTKASDKPANSLPLTGISPLNALIASTDQQVQSASSAPSSSNASSAPNVSSASTSSASNDNLPMCPYGLSCYRKNPQHFSQYKHPKTFAGPSPTQQNEKPTEKQDDSLSIKSVKKTDEQTNSLSAYKTLLSCRLQDSKVSVSDKKLFRDFRRAIGLNEQEHAQLIGQLGWTEDEYEDGERKDDTIELSEEFEVFKDPKGFKIIWITKQDCAKRKEYEIVFDRVCAKFYQTMAQAQGNYDITSVGVICNSHLKTLFETRKKELLVDNLGAEELGFHGTSEKAIELIAKGGFLLPDEISELNSKKKGKIDVLDNGFFGKGIYFSLYSDYAMYYSDVKKSKQILITKLLPGKTFKCKKRMDGQDCITGFDSHYSPKGNEIVMFSPEGCLPRYILTFSKSKSKVRAQEM